VLRSTPHAHKQSGHSLVKLKHYYSEQVEKESVSVKDKNESARRYLPVGSNSCVGVLGSLSLLGLLSGGWSLLRMLLVLQTQTGEVNETHEQPATEI